MVRGTGNGKTSVDRTSGHPLPARIGVVAFRITLTIVIFSTQAIAAELHWSTAAPVYTQDGAPAAPSDPSDEPDTRNWLQKLFSDMTVGAASRTYRYESDGNEARSARNENRTLNRTDLSFGYRTDWRTGTYFDAKADLRVTNDTQVAPKEELKFTNLLLRVGRGDKYEVQFGDVLGNLSTYTMSRSFEGLNLWRAWDGFKSGVENRVTAVGGRTVRAIDGIQFDQLVGGIRFEEKGRKWDKPIVKGIDWGLNASHITDVISSDKAPGTRSAITASVAALTGVLHLSRGFQVTAEYGRSWSNPNRRAAGGKVKEDDAYKAALTGKIWKFDVGADFEQVDPFFRTFAGSASPDVKRGSARLGLRLAPDLSLNSSAQKSRNNVANSPNVAISRSEAIAAGVRWKPFYRLPYDRLKQGSIDINFRGNQRGTSTGASITQTEGYDYRWSHSFGKLQYGVSYRYELSMDEVNARNDRRVRDRAVNISYPFDIERFHLGFTPSVSINSRRDAQPLLNRTTNQLTWNAGTGIRYRDRWSGRVAYNLVDADRPIGTTGTVNSRFDAQVDYRWGGRLDGSFSLEFHLNDIDDANPRKSLTEKETAFTANVRF